MIWAIAWRNIWRNKLRSIVIIIAVALGIFAGVFTWAFYRGLVVQRIQNAISTESSHIQIHHKDYLTNPDQKFVVPNLNKVAASVEKIPGVKAVAQRIVVNAMISSAETGAGVRIIGIDVEKEKQVTNIFSKVREGSYFFGNTKTPIVLGAALAGKLSVRLRSRVVLTLQTMDGTLTSGLFRVEGIYKTSNTTYDEMNVFLRITDIAALTGLEETSGHELAVLLTDNSLLNVTADKMVKDFPGLDTRTWREIMPEVSLVEESMDMAMYIFLGVVLAALVFGIVNTMLMAVLERVKELGMLMSVGMNKTRVFLMILLETVMLSLTGGVIGIIAGYLVTLLYSRHGISLSKFAEAYEKLGYETRIFPVPDPGIDLKVTIMVLITGILAALYPAMKAIGLNPADALRSDN